jgi:hypothetical protein
MTTWPSQKLGSEHRRFEAAELSAASPLTSLRWEHLSVAQVKLGMQGAGMMRLDPYHIVVDAERVEDCQVSSKDRFMR